jgi:hypothetical protein
MWSRDAGVFLREMVHWGYIGHACLTADCLMDMVRLNEEGFFTFPEHIDLGQPASGSELDGTNAIIIGLILLWERLPKDHPIKNRIYHFLHQQSSPLRYFDLVLKSHPLLPGSGEFGGGCGIEGLFYNVVQNNMAYLSLSAAARMEREMGDEKTALMHSQNAGILIGNILKYSVDEDGAWAWCINSQSLKPDSELNCQPINKGFGGLNGVASMYSDVLGLEPLESGWTGAGPSIKTFEKLASFPLRKEQFEKHGIWTQFDEFMDGLMTSASYGHCYALQMMLLFDKLDMADRALSYLAEATYSPVEGYNLTRENPFWFYERYPSPELPNIGDWWEGCGALNLVNVAEPLKTARLIVGVDDVSSDTETIIPRIPPSWAGFEVVNWPIKAGDSLLIADVRCWRTEECMSFTLNVKSGGRIPNLVVKLGESGHRKIHNLQNVDSVDLETC